MKENKKLLTKIDIEILTQNNEMLTKVILKMK